MSFFYHHNNTLPVAVVVAAADWLVIAGIAAGHLDSFDSIRIKLMILLYIFLTWTECLFNEEKAL